MYSEIIFYLLLFVLAFLYSSVGHGGASGYLALMAFYSFSSDTMRPVALLLNIFVSFIAFIQYYRGGFFKWDLFWPFAAASIPFSFIGGMVSINEDVYKKILAVMLLFSVVRLFGINVQMDKSTSKNILTLSLFIGSIIGFFSGMIGIGGGIILSPLILILHWADMKQTAAVSSLFIFVNSMSGLGGLYISGITINPNMGLMLSVAISGGLTGSFLGSAKFDTVILKNILAIVLIIASIKLILT